mgnify:CR=1 FL=1
MEQLRRGRKRQADSILMALKSTIFEFDYRFSRRNPAPEDVREFVAKLKAAYYHGTKLVAPIYVKAMEQLDREIEFLRSTLEEQERIREERRIKKWGN